MLKTIRAKTRKLYLLHVLCSVRILFEQTMYVNIVHNMKTTCGAHSMGTGSQSTGATQSRPLVIL